MDGSIKDIAEIGFGAGVLILFTWRVIIYIVKREFENLSQSLNDHDQILFGSKHDPIANPGLISEFRMMAAQQKTIVHDVAEIKTRLETLPDKVAKAVLDNNKKTN